MPSRSIAARNEQELLNQAAAWPEYGSLDRLSHDVLRSIAAALGLDFATAVLYDRLIKSDSAARPVLTPATSGNNDAELPRENAPSLIAVVPGAFYVESPQSGADGREIIEDAKRLGIPTAVIPTGSFGALDDNGRIIREWLLKHAPAGTALVSLSKGGADVKWALNHADAAASFRNVGTWINISGITEGTPLVSWLLGRSYRSLLVRPLFLWRNYDFGVLHQLDYGPQSPLCCPWNIPDWLSVIHVLGFPLRKHLTNGLARRGHRRLAGYGPNDGAGIVLYDAACRPGAIYPVWGVDHYLRNDHVALPRIFRKTLIWLCNRDGSREISVRDSWR